MSLMLLFLALVLVFGGGLLIVGVWSGSTQTMQEKIALVFEVYRYAVCFLSVFAFGLMAHALATGFLSNAGDATGLGTAGVGVLLSAAFFVVHWKMKNPALEA